MYIMLCAIDRALGGKIMEDLTGPGRERVDRYDRIEHRYEGRSLHFVGEIDWQIAGR